MGNLLTSLTLHKIRTRLYIKNLKHLSLPNYIKNGHSKYQVTNFYSN